MSTSTTPPNGDSLKTAPYLPFKTFLTALDRLRIGHPPVVDGSFWHGMSGGTQRQIVLAFKFFGLLGENGEVSKELDALARADDRRQLIGAMLGACFTAVFEIGVEHATPNQFNDALRQYNVSGSTLEKARSFFLQAAKFSEIALSPGIQSLSKPGSSGRRRRSTTSRNRDEIEELDDEDDEETPSTLQQKGTSRTIPLRGGGSATLSFDVDVWSMTAEDQQFVFEMIKRMTEYEQKPSPAPK
jgi:hypothetical protein